MACNFSLPLKDAPGAVLQKVRSAVQNQGGQFEGNEDSGNFHLSVFGSTIAGTYTVSDGTIEINISEKPFLLSCGTIEGFLKGQMGL